MKRIMHIDMNSYFASCELRGEIDIFAKILVVAPVNIHNRGVILAASYGARNVGITSGMSLVEAKRLYPNLLVVPINMPYYKEISHQVMKFLKSKFELVEQASIDEAYIDITNSMKSYDNELNLAKNIQKQIRNNFNLPCSIGIGDNRIQAKMSSNYKKPLGITIVNTNTFLDIFANSNISKVHGIGKVSQQMFYKHGLNKIKDVINLGLKEFLKLGFKEEHFNWCLGLSSSKIQTNRYIKNKSISTDKTYYISLVGEEQVVKQTLDVFEKAYGRLINKNYVCKGLSIKLRFEDFSQKQVSNTFEKFVSQKNILWNNVEDLLYKIYNFEKPVRLISISFNNLLSEKEYKIKYDRYFNLFEKFLKEK